MELNNISNLKKVSFKGFQHQKTDTGSQAYQFNCPYDSSKYDCEIQFYKIDIDEKKNISLKDSVNGKARPFYTTPVSPEGITIEPDYDLNLAEKEPFAYKFVLKDKMTGEIVQNRLPAEERREGVKDIQGCTVIMRNGTTVTKQGPMYLAVPDSFALGYKYADFSSSKTGEIIVPDDAEKEQITKKIHGLNRTYSNILGGNLAGIQAKLPEIRSAGFKRIITTPIKGGDNVSSHKYWNENNMLLAGGLGNINNYNSLQRDAFRYGMNLVDDGTFTSEGLQGIHFQRAIKWWDPENVPAEYYYFRMSGIQNDALGLGVVPENCQNLNHKLINSPFTYTKTPDGQYKISENVNYNPDRPTVLQIVDNSLLSDEQKNNKELFVDKYDKAADSKLAMNTHDDTIIPYSFEINPYEYKKNVENLNSVNSNRKNKKIDLNSPEGTMFVGYLSGIQIQPKTEGGFVCWNAHTDMVKLNYFTSDYDIELLAGEKSSKKRTEEMNKMLMANCNVQDMAVSAGKYWTRQVRQTHNEYVAQVLGNISSDSDIAYNQISDILNSQDPNNPKLPEDVRISKEVVENVLSGDYEFRPKESDYNKLLLSSLMDIPLDSLEFAPDTQGALSSPYLSKRAFSENHIGQSRFDAMNDKSYDIPEQYASSYNKMNKVFTDEMKSFASNVLSKVNESSTEKLFENGKLTEYGQYLIPLVANDIAKYALVKSLMPKTPVKHLENGEIAYDYDYMSKNGTLRALNINGDSQKDEANQIVNKIKSGIKNLDKNDVEFVASSISQRFENTNANSLKLAEVMVDRSGLGLDWRLDAAKDVGGIFAVRNGLETFDNCWNKATSFWTNFVNGVKSENPNSYTVAEFTDIYELINIAKPDESDVIYPTEASAIEKFMDASGITSEANYSYFFDGITNLFGYSFAGGYDCIDRNNPDEHRSKVLDSKLYDFFKKPVDYRRNSYVFASNADNPRLIHCLSMDMRLFHTDLTNKNRENASEFRKRAYMIMNNKNENQLSDYDKDIINNSYTYFNNVSSKAVANAELLKTGFAKACDDMKQSELNALSDSSNKDSKAKIIEQKYDNITNSFNSAIADVVNGKYYKSTIENDNTSIPDSFKKMTEKDGFGAKSTPDAFDIVVDQAIEKYGLGDMLSEKDIAKFRTHTDVRANEVGRVKTRIIMRYLNALAGNPTLYHGDELGMSGYETFCENATVQNRNPLDWSLVEGRNANKDIVKYRNEMLGLSNTRYDDDENKLEAVNNGTMYKLNIQEAKSLETRNKACKGDKLNVSSVMYQASNGALALTVFNANGINTTNDVAVEDIRPTNLQMDRILLEAGINKLTLNEGTEFKNINPNDNSTYKVVSDGDNYYIKRFTDGVEQPVILDSTTAPDGVFELYHLPENVMKQRNDIISQKSNANALYRAKHNIPHDAYAPRISGDDTLGNNLDISSK